MTALARTTIDLAYALADFCAPRKRFHVVSRTYGHRNLAEVYDSTTGLTWRCHEHQLSALLSGEDEPDTDWLVLVSEDDDDA